MSKENRVPFSIWFNRQSFFDLGSSFYKPKNFGDIRAFYKVIAKEAWDFKQKEVDTLEKELEKYKQAYKEFMPLIEYIQKNSPSKYMGKHCGDIAVQMLKDYKDILGDKE